MSQPVHAIIFDFFGVVSLRVKENFLQTHAPRYAERRQEFVDLGKQVDAGFISLETYEQELSAATGVSVEDYRQYMHQAHRINERLLTFIRDHLGAQYKIGMLSNAQKDLLTYAKPHQLEHIFDDITISAEIGVIKPDPRAFIIACQRLGVEPQHAIMVDDLADNCQAARHIGMRAIHYHSFEQFAQELHMMLLGAAPTPQKRATTLWSRAVQLAITSITDARNQRRAEGASSAAAEVVAQAHKNMLHTIWQMEERTQKESIVAWRIAALITALPHVAIVNEQKIAHEDDHELQVQLRKPLAYFNHDMAEVLSQLSLEESTDFIDRLFRQATDIMAPLHLAILPRAELESIGRGVAGESAFAQAVRANGWEVVHGTVNDDLRGIDLTIRTPYGELFVDLKRQRSFMHGLIELAQDHLLPRQQQQAAAQNGFARVTYSRHAPRPYQVYIVNADQWGVIDDFHYRDGATAARRIADFVRQAIRNK